jgi:signal transduction histidine kinase/ligand-binding sensor domain-containing protein
VRILPFILLLLLLVIGSRAAEATSRAGMLVRVWQSQDGLPGNVVRSVVQASDGYLWVATAEGVARFDGFEFEVIEPEGDLRRNRLAFSRLFAGISGRVWATTYQGGLYRSHNGRFHRILNNARGPQPPLVTQLIEDKDGTALFKRGENFGKVARNGLVSPVTPSPELLRRFKHNLAQRLHSGRARDSAGGLVLRDRLGRRWTTGPSGELTVTDDGNATIPVNLPQVGQAFGVNELLEDREGNIWLATPVNGLVRVRQARVEALDPNQGQNERAVTAVMQDRAGVWWIANRRGGLTRWTPEGSEYVDFIKSRHVRPAAALFEDRDSRLWVASRDGSVFRLGEDGFQPQFLKTQVPSKVRSITQDSKGTLWFGGSQGLASLTGETVRSFGRADGVGDLDLTVLQPFPGGRIIAGSSAGTILLGDDKGFQIIASPELLKHQWVSGILTISAKETWVSTLGGGLYLWDGERWTGLDAASGLPDSRLTCVVDDGEGHLWMGSLGGIIRAERKKLLAHIRSPQNPVQWLRLDHTDGLPSRECLGGFQPAGWRARDGQLWFPTGNGIARVHPDLVDANRVAPPVYLQKARANGVLQAVTGGPLQTEPGRARLEFHFVGLSLSAPEKTTYRARLSGLDDTWRELGTQRVAAYEAVPPGKYTFEVIAVNGDGLRSIAPARIPILIKPNFWETTWFFISVGGLIVAIAVGTGWLAARGRLKERILTLKVRNAREGERSRIARDLHDDLGAGLTEISILAALAAEDATLSPLHAPLHQLSIKAKYAVSSLDEIVWAVNPREDTLRSLIDYIAAFAREFLDIAGIPLRLDVARGIPDRPLTTSERHGVFLTAREALNNIVKHSAATEVMLRITLEDHLLAICIEDNGRGFELDDAQGGNGLENLKQRMREVGGDCRIESHRGQGTTVLLTLPLLGTDKPVS